MSQADRIKPGRNAVEKAKAVKRRRGYIRGLYVLIPVIAAVFFAIACLVSPNREFSDGENRNLAQFPKASGQSLMDGSFFKGINDYYSDQFVFRDQWISLKSGVDVARGQRIENGVIVGSGGYLFAEPEEPLKEAYEKNNSAINSFADGHPDIHISMILAPAAANILKDKVPGNIYVRDQMADVDEFGKRLSDKISFINAGNLLSEKKDEYIFYRTDHHWTSNGAKTVVDGAAENLGIKADTEDFDKYTVTEDFYGTLSSKSGLGTAKDSIDVFASKKDVEYYVRYADENIISSSMFNSEKLEEKDKYTVFFGGNHPLVEIHTTAQTGKNLLLFKDSYANSIVQFIYPYYDNIIMVDPRYYYEDISQVIKNNKISDVLFCYSVNILFTDVSLSDCLEGV